MDLALLQCREAADGWRGARLGWKHQHLLPSSPSLGPGMASTLGGSSASCQAPCTRGSCVLPLLPAPGSLGGPSVHLHLWKGEKLSVHSNWGFSSSHSLISPPHSVTAPRFHPTQVPGPGRGSPGPPNMSSPFCSSPPRAKESFWRPQPFSCEYTPVKSPTPVLHHPGLL